MAYGWLFLLAALSAATFPISTGSQISVCTTPIDDARLESNGVVLSQDASFIVTTSDKVVCVWVVAEMKNLTEQGSYCHEIGKFVAMAPDGSMIAVRVQKTNTCFIKMQDWMGPDPTGAAKCINYEPLPTQISSGPDHIATFQGEGSFTVGKVSAFHTFKYHVGFPAGTPLMGDARRTRMLSNDGRAAWASGAEVTEPTLIIKDIASGEMGNTTLKWLNPAIWGYSADDKTQRLFYFSSPPGRERTLCAMLRSEADAKCSTIKSRPGYGEPVLLGGYTAADGSHVALVLLPNGTSAAATCTYSVENGGLPKACLPGISNANATPKQIIVPKGGSGAWLLAGWPDKYLVNLADMKDGARVPVYTDEPNLIQSASRALAATGLVSRYGAICLFNF